MEWTKAWRRVALAALPVLGLLAGSHQVSAADEWELKAAFVYRLAGFVEWTKEDAGADEPFAIAVLGDGALADALEQTVADRRLHGRPVTVRRIAELADLGGAEVLVVTAAEQVPSVLAAPLDSVLTISDAEGFARAGGILELVREGQHVRFEVNETSARRAGLRVSAKVMRLAAAVHSGRGG